MSAWTGWFRHNIISGNSYKRMNKKLYGGRVVDIFEMAGTQFQSWSMRQIAIFVVLLVVLAIGLTYSVRQKRLHGSQAIAAWILALFLGII